MNATTRTQIECAVARGRSLEWMLEHLGCTTMEIDETLRYLDKVNAEDTARELLVEKRRRVTYSPGLARERDIVAINAAKARNARSLLEQVVDAPRGPRCGSWAAYVRHHRRWEQIDPLCRLAAQQYQRESRRAERARKRVA